jgi:hypothetical protein
MLGKCIDWVKRFPRKIVDADYEFPGCSGAAAVIVRCNWA